MSSKIPIVRKNTSRKVPDHDFMKYWRVVRYWARVKYEITTAELDMILFLYSEQFFNKSQFKEYEELMSWDRNRFYRLIKADWIHVWRKKDKAEATLYELTYKAKKMVESVYKKLNREKFSETYVNNPLFRHDASYQDKVYRNFIKGINKEIQDIKKKGTF